MITFSASSGLTAIDSSQAAFRSCCHATVSHQYTPMMDTYLGMKALLGPSLPCFLLLATLATCMPFLFDVVYEPEDWSLEKLGNGRSGARAGMFPTI